LREEKHEKTIRNHRNRCPVCVGLSGCTNLSNNLGTSGVTLAYGTKVIGDTNEIEITNFTIITEAHDIYYKWDKICDGLQITNSWK
jgi:hypothetical protein